MTVSVLMPFSGGDIHRRRAKDYVYGRYQSLGYEVVIGHCEGPWCKATAVEDAFNRSTGDLLIVADADCWAERIEKAVWWLDTGEVPWVMPYMQVYRLTAAASAAVYAGGEPTQTSELERRHDAATGGGIVLVPRETYRRIPLDRRFIGWGGEDYAWGHALTTLAGNPGRLSGLVWHLYHPLAEGHPSYFDSPPHGLCSSEANEQLRARYEAAFRNPTAMNELLEEARCSATQPSPSSGPSPADTTNTATT